MKFDKAREKAKSFSLDVAKTLLFTDHDNTVLQATPMQLTQSGKITYLLILT